MRGDLAFYLKGRPGSGGANSVVQEFAALVRNYGVGYLVIQGKHSAAFNLAYDLAPSARSRVLTSLEDVPEGAIPVATTNDSVADVRRAFADRTETLLYYVQDYEPLFYTPLTVQHHTAVKSFERVNDVMAVVKTDWLRDVLLRETLMPVVKIRPSIDRSIYFPEARHSRGGRRVLLAMVRPATPRRAPQRTVAILNRAVEEFGNDVDFVVFGTNPADLSEAGLHLDPRIENAGRLAPSQVARIVRQAHYMLDVSDYQAFGRSLAEGMACGVIPIATRYGAPSSIIDDGRSGFLVNPGDIDSAFAVLERAVSLSEVEFSSLSDAAMFSVADWSTDATACDWLTLLADLGRG
jgi:glycosyltransferase involved in cell wall biosynthesis